MLSDSTFVSVYRIRAQHLLVVEHNAIREGLGPLGQMMLLMTQVTLFDDKPPSVKKIQNLTIDDFNRIAKQIQLQ